MNLDERLSNGAYENGTEEILKVITEESSHNTVTGKNEIHLEFIRKFKFVAS